MKYSSGIDSRNHRCILPRGSCITSGSTSAPCGSWSPRAGIWYVSLQSVHRPEGDETSRPHARDACGYYQRRSEPRSTNRYALFGHHFAAIAGAGPLVGPVLAAQMGYLPGNAVAAGGGRWAGAGSGLYEVVYPRCNGAFSVR